MSRERKERRRRAQQMQRMLELIAKAEGRKLDSLSDREDYQRELMIRGIIVDMGPHHSGRGRHVSFRLDDIPLDLSLEQVFNLAMGGIP